MGRWHWTLFFGVMYMLAEYGTFSMDNMLAANKVSMPEFPMVVYGAAISLIGMGVGVAISKLKKGKGQKTTK